MKKLLISFFILSVLSPLLATHNRAGEILYKRIAPFSQGGSPVYTYSITVIKYMDDGQGIADRCVDTVFFGDGSKGIALRINGSTSSCFCGSVGGTVITCGSLIVNQPAYKVKKSVYSVIHTYAGPGNYAITSTDPNRNSGVHNIPNSVNVPFFLESLLVINPGTDLNSSPEPTIAPVDQATLGLCFYHNMGAVDADGDSLSYQVTPIQAPGYFAPETGAGGSFSINPVTGLLTWCSPQFLAEYNVAITVREWRKNTSGVYVLNGSVLRDMQVLVQPGPGPLSIKNFNENETAVVYPNPFTQAFEIALGAGVKGTVAARLFSHDGRLVFSTVSQVDGPDFYIAPGQLDAGVYLLELSTAHGLIRRKIVKE